MIAWRIWSIHRTVAKPSISGVRFMGVVAVIVESGTLPTCPQHGYLCEHLTYATPALSQPRYTRACSSCLSSRASSQAPGCLSSSTRYAPPFSSPRAHLATLLTLLLPLLAKISPIIVRTPAQVTRLRHRTHSTQGMVFSAVIVRASKEYHTDTYMSSSLSLGGGPSSVGDPGSAAVAAAVLHSPWHQHQHHHHCEPHCDLQTHEPGHASPRPRLSCASARHPCLPPQLRSPSTAPPRSSMSLRVLAPSPPAPHAVCLAHAASDADIELDKLEAGSTADEGRCCDSAVSLS
jgi:hypothetical protein